MKYVDIVVGTRPETIKMATVYQALKENPEISVRLISSGQHRELQSQAMKAFGLVPDVDLKLMRHGQSLSSLTARLLIALEKLYQTQKPDLLMVHGDTTTAFGTALAGFYQGISVAHVEAGLRTRNLLSPFPEEFNRQLTAQMAQYHFAVDDTARSNLLKEGVKSHRVQITGNTIGDALSTMLPKTGNAGPPSILVTLHRRENQESLKPMLQSVRDLAEDLPKHPVVFPVHPSLGKRVEQVLGGLPNIRLGKPMDYPSFLGELLRAQVVVTDSGGVQEEAYQIGRPVVVMRNQSERNDGVAEGRVTYAQSHTLREQVKHFLQAPGAPPNLRIGASKRIANGVQKILAEGCL